MKNKYRQIITGKLVAFRRLNNSKNGNPKYTLAIDDGKTVHLIDTKSDASCGYAVCWAMVSSKKKLSFMIEFNGRRHALEVVAIA